MLGGGGGGGYIIRLETVAMHDSESFRNEINAPRVLRKIGQKEFKPLKDLSLHGKNKLESIVGKICTLKHF